MDEKVIKAVLDPIPNLLQFEGYFGHEGHIGPTRVEVDRIVSYVQQTILNRIRESLSEQ